MPHVLVGGAIDEGGLALLQAAEGVSYDYVPEVSEDSVARRIAGADALVVRTQTIGAETIARAPRLRIVSRHGVGYDSVDVAALNARGIALTVVGDVNSRSVAEHAMMLLLASAKRLLPADRAVRAGDWEWRNGFLPAEMWRKTLLIVGYGRIGRHLAQMAAGFGMNVLAHDPFLDPWPEGLAGRAQDLRAALGEADAVAVCTPKSGAALIGRSEIAAMQPGAVIVNTSRGGLVDEAALAEALQSGHLGGAGLDVFEAEPVSSENGMLIRSDAVLTPHVAGLTRECSERMAVAAVQNVLDFFAGRIDPGLVVNRDALVDA